MVIRHIMDLVHTAAVSKTVKNQQKRYDVNSVTNLISPGLPKSQQIRQLTIIFEVLFHFRLDMRPRTGAG